MSAANFVFRNTRAEMNRARNAWRAAHHAYFAELLLASPEDLALKRRELRVARLRYLAAIRACEADLGLPERLGMAGRVQPDPTLTPGDHPYPYRLDEGAAIIELATGEYR